MFYAPKEDDKHLTLSHGLTECPPPPPLGVGSQTSRLVFVVFDIVGARGQVKVT